MSRGQDLYDKIDSSGPQKFKIIRQVLPGSCPSIDSLTRILLSPLVGMAPTPISIHNQEQ